MNTNQWRNALYAEFVAAAGDGAKVSSSVEEHLRQILVMKRIGLHDRELSRLLGLPTEYIRSLQATMV